jgi:hypothetical protein
MARLVLQPLDLLLLVALMLLAVQNDRSWSDRLALVLPLSWLVGGLAGLGVGVELPLALPCTAIVTATANSTMNKTDSARTGTPLASATGAFTELNSNGR